MIRKWINYIGGIILLGVIVFAIYPFVVGERQMEKFCATVGSGEMKSELMMRANAKKYAVRETEVNGKEMVLVIDSSAMGRFICEVKLEEGMVTSSRYVFND